MPHFFTNFISVERIRVGDISLTASMKDVRNLSCANYSNMYGNDRRERDALCSKHAWHEFWFPTTYVEAVAVVVAYIYVCLYESVW